MQTILDTLSTDHKHCDDLFARAESLILDGRRNGRWDEALRSLQEFTDSLLRHFRMEEDVMFPAFEERTGMQGGPTVIMRAEHQQMRALLDRMHQGAMAGDSAEVLGHGETLLVLMQQHNIKEEQILYPMADQALSGAQDDVIRRMAAC